MKYYNIYTHMYIYNVLEFFTRCTNSFFSISCFSLPKKYTITTHFPGENASINVTHVLTIPITIPKINTTHAK